ncbi:MAG TPA: CHAT domain-containing tetratricopeptide repeat protein [Pyrinomonadaceae bacterium]|jgi:CHAT domain-containing protein
MKKIVSISLKQKLKNRLYQYSSSLDLQILFLSLMFIALFQIQASALDESPNELNLNQNTETQVLEQDIRELKPGEIIERRAKANEIHGYQITLEAGTSVEITFGKRDISPQFTAIVPDGTDYTVPGNKIPAGKELSRVIAGAGEFLVEPMVVVAEKTGNYIITARFLTSGTYSINCSMPRVTTETDRKYAKAGKLFAEIRQSIEADEPMWKLRDKFEERAAIYRALDDTKSFALSLNDVGRAYSSIADWGKAVKYYKEALQLFRSLKSTDNIMDNLWLVGRASHEIGDYQAGIDSYNEILSFSRSQANKNAESSTLHQLGVVYHLIADEQKAREFYEQSLAVRRSMTPPTIASMNGEGVTLTNIGNLYRGVGGGEIPIDSFPPRTTSDRQKALEYYQQALEVARRTRKLFPNASTLEPFNLQQIGNTYKELGNYAEAINYLSQSLELYKSGNRKSGQTNVLVSIGNLYIVKGEYKKGFEYFEQAVALLRAGSYPVNQIGYLNNIAKDYYRAGETQKALELYNEALELSRAKGQQDNLSVSLFEIARIERDIGNFNNARNKIEEVIQTVESLRAKITSQDVRTTYFATNKRYYDFYIDLLMQAHKSQPEKDFDLLALQTSEKSRSRSLLDLLVQSKIDIKQGVDPLLIEREQRVRTRLAEKANQQSRLLFGKHTKEEAEKISKEVSDLTAQYEDVQAQIRSKSPRYAALTQASSLDAKQIRQLLDPGTILLEYSLGEKKSYLWTVSTDSIKSFDLPDREEIETQARKVYELLTARNQNPENETDAQKSLRIKTAETEYSKTGEKLSRMLLGPAISEIGKKRLVIVPDGALNYLPFSALPNLTYTSAQPATKSESPTRSWQPLGVNHEIITLPSASVLALLRDEAEKRTTAQKMLAVYADPVFSQKDVRLSSSFVSAAKQKAQANKKPFNRLPFDKQELTANNKSTNQSFNRDFERAISDLGLASETATEIPRLAFSRREADSIYNVSSKNLSLKAVDFKANKADFINSNVDQYRVLHIATHGLLNSQHPELSGIVLSLVNESGQNIDGFLRLQDIYNLKLSADLVVLSACNTALGRDVKGEGLIGLTRGFMYAGAPRVVASLWKVDDAATAELMSIFYRKMLTENLRPAAALRAAQTEMMKQTRWKSPYYWAPFIIQGEWK